MAGESSIPKGLFRETAVLYARLAWRVFFSREGSRPRPSLRRITVMAVFLPAFAMLEGLHWVAFWLDEILYPGFRRVEVRTPLFITGIPRSGTTLLHRVLAQDKNRYTWFTLWELVLAPAIVERKVIWGVARLDRALGRPMSRLVNGIAALGTRGLESVHKLALDEPEEDFLLLLPVLGCFILVVAFPHDREITDLAYFDERIAPARRRRLMAFYKAMLQRHMYAHGTDRTLLSKNVSFTPLLGSLLETFPDCRIVACTREPSSAVPSQISAMKAGWRFFGNDTQTMAFRDRWVDLMRHYYACQRDTLQVLPRNRAYLVDTADLKTHLEREVGALYQAFGFDMSAEFATRLNEEAEQSRAFRSKHTYSVEGCGLDKEGIKHEFSELYANGQDPRDRTPPGAGIARSPDAL